MIPIFILQQNLYKNDTSKTKIVLRKKNLAFDSIGLEQALNVDMRKQTLTFPFCIIRPILEYKTEQKCGQISCGHNISRPKIKNHSS